MEDSSIANIDNKGQKGCKTLFRMMGAYIKKLLSRRISRDDVEHLRQVILETVCLGGCLFPAKQNYFEVHKYMDLVFSIPILGPPNLQGVHDVLAQGYVCSITFLWSSYNISFCSLTFFLSYVKIIEMFC